jgi:hypothetical protein
MAMARSSARKLRLRDLLLCRRASTMEEFVVVLFAMCLFALVLIETSLQLLTMAALDYGLREASRFGITGAAYPPSMASSPPASRSAAIVDIVSYFSAGLINPSYLTVTLTAYPSFTAMTAGTGGVTGPGTASQVVVYNVSYQQFFLTSIAASIIGLPYLTHTATTVVQNEPFPSS